MLYAAVSNFLCSVTAVSYINNGREEKKDEEEEAVENFSTNQEREQNTAEISLIYLNLPQSK